MKAITDSRRLFLINFCFVIISGIVFVAIGLLVTNDILPLAKESGQPTPRWVTAWMGVYALVSLVIVPITLLVCIKRRSVRLALGPLFLVFIVQIVKELVFRRMFFALMPVIVDFVYICFRVWQLLQARLVTKAASDIGARLRTFIHVIIVVSLVFCTVDIVLMLIFYLPKLLPT